MVRRRNFELLDQEEAKTIFQTQTFCLVRNDEIFEVIAAIEEKLIEKKKLRLMLIVQKIFQTMPSK